jgi:hypothetical protein
VWGEGDLPLAPRHIGPVINCFGRIYRIEEIDGQGLLVLDVSADIDHRFGGFMNDIRLEAEFLEEVV